jgi:hypothetical protein
MIDPSAPKHAKRLLTVPEEAKLLQDAVTDVLDPRHLAAREAARIRRYTRLALPFGIGQGSSDSTRTDG